MKSLRMIGYAWIALMGTVQLMASSTSIHTQSESRQIISLLDVDETTLQDFSEGKMSGCILECPQGTLLPFKLNVKGQFLALQSSPIEPVYLKILKSCYVRCEEKENFLFSLDREQWKGFSEFFTGELRVSVHAENGEPTAGLELVLNQRNS